MTSQGSSSADRAVQYLSLHTPHIRGSPVSASFASNEADHRKIKSESQALRVLLVTVTDIRYPVDIELLSRLFCTYGQIEKVRIPTKSVHDDAC